MQDVYDVIVVGAGSAGIAAAHELHKAKKKVLVLEARERIGGRVHTVRDRGVVEAGAEFIHGEHAVTNVLAKEAGIQTEYWAYEDADSYRLFGKGGGIRSDTEALYKRFLLTDDDLWKYDGPDISLAEYYKKFGKDPEAEFYKMREIAGIEAADPEKLSVKAIAHEGRLATNGAKDYWLPEGYDKVLKWLAKGLTIKLKTKVTRVIWKEGGVSILCENGAVYNAPKLIITIPVGVMKMCPPEFLPRLPDQFVRAVRDIGFGVASKVTLWIDGPLPYFNALATDGPVGFWWQRRFHGHTVVVGFATDAGSRELSHMSEKSAVAAGIDDLADGVGNTVRHMVSHARHFSWLTDPFALGSYSYPTVGMGDARSVLSTPIEDTIYYCGEATNTRGHAAMVHGAIEEGRRVAHEIIDDSIST